MGATTRAKRREARHAPSPSSHIQREVIGVILIALGLLMLLSLLSFVPGEAKIVAAGAPDAHPPRNLIGSFGALLAGAFFYGLGGAAYLFPLLLGRLGFRCFSQAPVSLRLRTAASSLAAVLFLGAFLHLETTGVPTLTSGMISRGMAGGLVGQTIAEGLRAVFAGTGAHILIITGFLVSLLLTTPLSLAEAVRRMPERWAVLREGLSALIPERSIAVQKESVNRRSRAKSSRPTAVTQEAESAAERIEGAEPSPPPSSPGPVIQPFPVIAAAVDGETTEPEVLDPPAEPADYQLPDPEILLSDPSGPMDRMSDEELRAQSEVLSRALMSFGIEGIVTEVRPGGGPHCESG
ncbi:MAG: hypothetical protein CV088_09190 [Nitrospira sp. LK70]|nr:hypothetical protein [Nitrospira sp. LK70]